MDKAELQDKVCTILADQLAVDRDKVTPDARFSEDLDADSLDLVEAVKTVGQAVDLVATKVGASA